MVAFVTNSMHKKLRYCFCKWYWWWKNPANECHTWPQPTRSSSLRCCFPLMTNFMHKKLRYQLILFKEIDDQKILLSGRMRGITGHTQPKVVVLNVTFPWSLTPWIKNLYINYFFTQILLIKESYNVIGQETHLATSNEKWHSQMMISKQKYKNWLVPDALMPKESCTLIGQVVHLAWPHSTNSGSLRCYLPFP